VIVCPKCGKENQDHYKFCLGCGNELPRDAGGGNRPFRPTPPAVNVPATAARNAQAPVVPVAPQPVAPPVVAPSTPQPPPPAYQPPPPEPQAYQPPPQAYQPPAQAYQPPPQAYQPPPQAQPFQAPPQAQPFQAPPPAQPLQAPPPAQPFQAPPQAASPSGAPAVPPSCPNCGTPNPRGNRFCITCGFDMASAPQPQAAPPQQQVAPPQQQQVAPPQQQQVAPPQQQQVAPTPPARPAVVERARLVLIRPDGSEGGVFPLHEGESHVGRESGPIFQQDTYLSPRHATFLVAPGAVTVRDDDALNGVYVRVERQVPVEINDEDVFRIGQEILRFDAFSPVQRLPDGTERIGSESEGLIGRISLVTGRDTYGNAFPVPVTGLYLGRERGDILFPEDGYVSGLHCQLAVVNGRLTLTDVGSSNGSYLRIRGQRGLRNGDYLLMGQQLFRLHVL
jgi:pSer/pThr/pTyr-binding forkhead associated (FHA) protein